MLVWRCPFSLWWEHPLGRSHNSSQGFGSRPGVTRACGLQCTSPFPYILLSTFSTTSADCYVLYLPENIRLCEHVALPVEIWERVCLWTLTPLETVLKTDYLAFSHGCCCSMFVKLWTSKAASLTIAILHIFITYSVGPQWQILFSQGYKLTCRGVVLLAGWELGEGWMELALKFPVVWLFLPPVTLDYF